LGAASRHPPDESRQAVERGTDAEQAVAATAKRPIRSGTGMIIEDVDRHAREQPGARAVVEVSADGSVRELVVYRLRPADRSDAR